MLHENSLHLREFCSVLSSRQRCHLQSCSDLESDVVIMPARHMNLLAEPMMPFLETYSCCRHAGWRSAFMSAHADQPLRQQQLMKLQQQLEPNT